MKFYYDLRTVPSDDNATEPIYTNELYGGSIIPGQYSEISKEEEENIVIVEEKDLPEEIKRIYAKIDNEIELTPKEQEYLDKEDHWYVVQDPYDYTEDLPDIKAARAAVVDGEMISRYERAMDL